MTEDRAPAKRPPFRPDLSLIISRDRARSEEEVRAILEGPDEAPDADEEAPENPS